MHKDTETKLEEILSLVKKRPQRIVKCYANKITTPNLENKLRI